MKKLFLAMVTAVIIFSFVSCGKAKTEAKKEDKTQAKTTTALAVFEEEPMPKEQESKSRYVAGELLVKFKPEVNQEDIPKIIKEEYKCEILDIIKGLEVYRLKIPAGKTVEEMVQFLSKDPRVKYAEPNIIYRLQQ